MRIVASVALVAAVWLVSTNPAASADGPAPPAPSAPIWRELTFSARKLLLSASTTVAVAMVTRADLLLRPTPAGDEKAPPAGPFARIVTRTALPFGRGEEAVTIVDAVSGEWLQTDKLVRGHGDYGKTLRATATGAYVWRVAPRDGREAAAAPERWSRLRESRLTAPSATPPGLVVSDPYALLYLISQARLGPAGGGRSWLLLSAEGLLRVDVAAGGLRRIRASYERSWRGGGQDQVRRDVTAREVVVSARAVTGDGGGAGPQLELLGLRGNLRILVDAASDVPLEIHGRSDGLGEVTVRLAAVELAEPPRAGGGA